MASLLRGVPIPTLLLSNRLWPGFSEPLPDTEQDVAGV